MYNNIIVDKKFRELEIIFRIIGEIMFPVFSSYSEFTCILFLKNSVILVNVSSLMLMKRP